MIFLDIRGRFGNQLTQYWLGRYLADLWNVPLSVSIPDSTALARFLYPVKLSIISFDDVLKKSQSMLNLSSISSPDKLANPGCDCYIQQFNENSALICPFQTYIQSIYPISWAPRIDQIAIHVRLGDLTHQYVKYESNYINLVKNVCQSYSTIPAVIYTDEPNHLAVNRMKTATRASVRNSPDELTDFHELVHSAILISSSSTFIWWAAFLNPYLIAYHVYLPECMLATRDHRQLYNQDYLPKTWHIYN